MVYLKLFFIKSLLVLFCIGFALWWLEHEMPKKRRAR
jgi:hypothetical protein